MATKREKGEQVEVMFADNFTYDGLPRTKGTRAFFSREDAESIIAGGYGIEYTEDLKAAEEKRKQLPQNRPLKESDLVIATHDSGEQTVHKDYRERGPLDAKATPGSAWTLADSQKAGGSVDAHRIAMEINDVDGQRIEALPAGDLPTGVPYGVLEASQAAAVKMKPNVVPAKNVATAEEMADVMAKAAKTEKKAAAKK
jgi:hypothetical protein